MTDESQSGAVKRSRKRRTKSQTTASPCRATGSQGSNRVQRHKATPDATGHTSNSDPKLWPTPTAYDGNLARRSSQMPRIAASAPLQNPQDFGKRNFEPQKSYSVSSARDTFSKILSNLGNRGSATQNRYSVNSATITTTIWSGTRWRIERCFQDQKSEIGLDSIRRSAIHRAETPHGVLDGELPVLGASAAGMGEKSGSDHLPIAHRLGGSDPLLVDDGRIGDGSMAGPSGRNNHWQSPRGRHLSNPTRSMLLELDLAL